MQAYGFTSTPILGALASAKRRGVDVQVIADKSAVEARYSGATYVSNAGIPVWIDYLPRIAHSKIVVVDVELVVTGSFNFTKSAQERNAVNVVFIRSAEVAGWFLTNWESRRAVAEPYRVGE